MKKPFKKNIPAIEIEGAHGGSGKRQLLLSPADMISTNIDGATKGYLAGGIRLIGITMMEQMSFLSFCKAQVKWNSKTAH